MDGLSFRPHPFLYRIVSNIFDTSDLSDEHYDAVINGLMCLLTPPGDAVTHALGPKPAEGEWLKFIQQLVRLIEHITAELPNDEAKVSHYVQRACTNSIRQYK